MLSKFDAPLPLWSEYPAYWNLPCWFPLEKKPSRMRVCACRTFYCTSSLILPVVVSIAERPDGDGEGLPHGVQRVLHHLGLVADGEPGDSRSSGIWNPNTHTALRKYPAIKIFPLPPALDAHLHKSMSVCSSRELNLILSWLLLLWNPHNPPTWLW